MKPAVTIAISVVATIIVQVALKKFAPASVRAYL